MRYLERLVDDAADTEFLLGPEQRRRRSCRVDRDSRTDLPNRFIAESEQLEPMPQQLPRRDDHFGDAMCVLVWIGHDADRKPLLQRLRWNNAELLGRFEQRCHVDAVHRQLPRRYLRLWDAVPRRLWCWREPDRGALLQRLRRNNAQLLGWFE